MAIYYAGAEPSPTLLKTKRQARWWLAGSLLLLALTVYAGMCSPQVAAHEWLADIVHSAGVLFLMVAIFAGIIALTMGRTIRRDLQQEFEVTPAGISRRHPALPELFIPLEDVVSFAGGNSGGLLLRLKKQPQLLSVPPNIENLDGFRQELTAMGVPQSAKPSLGRSLLKLLAIFVPMIVCVEIFFSGKNPIEVGLAGICYVALLTWSSYRSSNNRYAGRRPRHRMWQVTNWIWLVTLGLWLFVVVMRVERVAHPRSHPASPTQCVEQPSQQKH